MKNVQKLNLDDLKSYILSEATKAFENMGDALEMEMNSNDSELGNSDGDFLVKSKGKNKFDRRSEAPSKAENIEVVDDLIDIDMNEMDSEIGSDGEIATAVKVDATSKTKNGTFTKGQHEAKFDSKTQNPSTASSAPYEDRKTEVKMNSQDKATDHGAKTFVEPGSDINRGASTGQHKANFSEKAKNEKETAERIAKGIQLPETFKNKKEILSFINEEAKKIANLL